MTTLVTPTENRKVSFSSVKHIVTEDVSNDIDFDDRLKTSQSIFKHASTQCCENCKQQSCAAR